MVIVIDIFNLKKVFYIQTETKMKKLNLVIIILLISAGNTFSQFKGYDDKGSSYNTGSSNLILGFINPKNFTMNHSFNVSMVNTGYGSVSLTSYINSMNYRISEKFNISADVKFQYSPYASSHFGTAYSNSLQKDLSGVYLSRASLNYKISDNSFITFQYNNYKEGDYYGNFYNPGGFNAFQNPGWR